MGLGRHGMAGCRLPMKPRFSYRGSSSTVRPRSQSADADQGGPNKMINAVTTAVKSSFFWAYVAMVDLLAGFSSGLMGWAEGCGCPGHQHTCHGQPNRHDLNGRCQMKGRRAPELAAGQLQQVIDTFLSGALSQLTGLCYQLSPPDKTKIFEDWNNACAARRQQAFVSAS